MYVPIRVILAAAGAFAAVGMSGCSPDSPAPGSSRFVTESSFQDNLARQTSLTPQTIEQLRQHGVTGDSRLKLEFFFYAREKSRAESLAESLRELGYEAMVGSSEHDRKTFVITGWTTPIRMDANSVVAWTEQMVRLGYEHDAEFDGWGTTPDQ